MHLGYMVLLVPRIFKSSELVCLDLVLFIDLRIVGSFEFSIVKSLILISQALLYISHLLLPTQYT